MTLSVVDNFGINMMIETVCDLLLVNTNLGLFCTVDDIITLQCAKIGFQTFNQSSLFHIKTSSSAVAKRPRDASCLSVVS